MADRSHASRLAPLSDTADSAGPPWVLAGLFALVVLIWFLSLGTRSLIHPDEGRYAALALEMARSGDWVTPRLNGLLYFEKPPLQYWIGALSFQVFGISEFSARLWPGAAGFLTLLVIAYTAARLWGREAAVHAFAISASMTWIVANSHFLSLDAGLNLFLTLALCAALLAQNADPGTATHRRWVLCGWAAMALAVLSKGLVGIVIPGCALLLASLASRDLGVLRRLRWGPGLLIFLAIAAPWFVLVSLRNPGFAEFFFIHEHFARYLTQAHRREGAWWYYLPFLLAGMLPWTSGLPWLLGRGGSRHVQGHGGHQGTGEVGVRNLLVAWAAFVLVFFSASGSKLPSYILPMFPALALLLTRQLRGVDARVLRWHLLLPALVWLVLGVAATQVDRLAAAAIPAPVRSASAWAVGGGAMLFLSGAAIAACLLGRRRVSAAVVCVAFAHFAALSLVIQGHDAFGQLKSADAPARSLLPAIDAATPVFAVRSYDQTLPFYLRRSVVLVEFIDEFGFGQQREPGKSIANLDEFIIRWNALPRCAAYMTHDTWRDLGQRGVPMRVVFEDPRRVVVMKP
jgi:4-amino-4-deoxy-L-arabinose transferase-like glycosyltransferase